MANAQLKAVITAEDRASKVIAGVSSSLDDTRSRLQKLAPYLKTAGAVGLAAGGALALLGKSAISAAADYEQSQIAFKTMLGSAEKANALLKDLSDFGKKTPFELPGLIDASKKLLAFGTAQEQIIPTLRQLGDIAAGVGIPVNELADLYGKAQVQGRLFAEDVNQLTGRGIPVIQEFAKQFGVSESEVRKLVESGQIGFPQLQRAFADLTGEGSKFGGLMDAQSASFSGMVSNFKDGVSEMMRQLGAVLLPYAKKAVDELNKILSQIPDWVRTAIDRLTPVLMYLWSIVQENLVPAFRNLKNAVEPFQPALAAIAETIGKALAAALIELIADVIKLTADILNFTAILINNFHRAVNGAIEITHKLVDAFKDLSDRVVRTISEISAALAATWEQTVTRFNNGVQLIKNGWDSLITFISARIQDVKNAYDFLLNLKWEQIHEAMAAGARAGTRAAAEIYIGLWEYVINQWSAWLPMIGNYFAQIGTEIGDGLTAIKTDFSDWITGVTDSLQTAFNSWYSAIADWFEQLPGRFAAWLDNTLSVVNAFFSNAYQTISNGLSRWTENIEAWLSSLPERFTTWLNNVAESIKIWFAGLFNREEVVAAIDESGVGMVARLIESLDKNKLTLIGKWAAIIALVILSLPLLLVAAIATFTIDMTLKFVKAIQDNAPKIREAIFEAFKNAFFSVIDAVGGWIGQIVGKISSGIAQIKNGISSAAGTIGGAAGNLFRAGGGAVNPNRSYIVGENGPEFFTPSGYGSITPNNRLGAGGGITVNVYGDVSGQELIEKVKNGIMRELKMNVRL